MTETLPEGEKLVTVTRSAGAALISSDLHGNLRDFQRLRELFLASEARGETPLWISLGDWVHGPADGQRRDITDKHGQPLYNYPDETPQLLEELFALMDRYPDQVMSLCGNHEHAHIGGRRTRKFHEDEAAHLESRLNQHQISQLRRRFASWPVMIRLAPCGVVLSHGAPYPGSAEEFAQIRFSGPRDRARADLLLSVMSRYGFNPGEDVELLTQLSSVTQSYKILLHGHDREEEGFASSGDAALLLCTSFGARQERKTYGWIDLARRYHCLSDLRPGYELRLLWRSPLDGTDPLDTIDTIDLVEA